MRGAIIAAVAMLAGGAAAQPASFSYDPKPRWVEDPKTDVVCAAVRAECKALLKDGSIETDWTYAAVYDGDGMLVGLRSLKSTGCKPLDEHLLLDHRHFLTVFTKPGQPDLDEVTLEFATGTSRDSVRMVKREHAVGFFRLVEVRTHGSAGRAGKKRPRPSPTFGLFAESLECVRGQLGDDALAIPRVRRRRRASSRELSPPRRIRRRVDFVRLENLP